MSTRALTRGYMESRLASETEVCMEGIMRARGITCQMCGGTGIAQVANDGDKYWQDCECLEGGTLKEIHASLDEMLSIFIFCGSDKSSKKPCPGCGYERDEIKSLCWHYAQKAAMDLLDDLEQGKIDINRARKLLVSGKWPKER